MTLFVKACSRGNIDVLKHMLGQDLDTAIGSRGLRRACKHGHLNVVQLFMPQPSKYATTATFRDMCYTSCEYGQVDIIKYLYNDKQAQLYGTCAIIACKSALCSPGATFAILNYLKKYVSKDDAYVALILAYKDEVANHLKTE